MTPQVPGQAMIHLVCDCGGLVSAPSAAGSRTLPCRACGKVHEVPGDAALGLGPLPPEPPPDDEEEAAEAGSGGGRVPAAVPQIPRFDADDRLDLHALEGEAVRLLTIGRLVLAAGLAAAGGAWALPGRTIAERVLLSCACLFVAVAAWSGFRAARSACLASVALAQRQREILATIARG